MSPRKTRHAIPKGAWPSARGHRRRFQPLPRHDDQTAHHAPHGAATQETLAITSQRLENGSARSPGALSRPADQCHRLFSRSGSVRGAQGEGLSGNRRDKSPTTPLRVWVPGCSTGQEAYSFAMALMEFFDGRPVRPPIQIFATDLSDPPALERARAGIYPDSIEVEVSVRAAAPFFPQRGPRLPDRENRSATCACSRART